MTEMNERADEANVPREPWQRLLEDSADGPPETTDARIRAAARRDLTPRGPRWWIPASLAASFVLAVLVVRSEIGSGGRIPILVTERGGDEAMDARIIDRNEGEQAREPGQSPAAASAKPSKQTESAESDAYGYTDSELGQEAAGTGPLVGGPERDLKSASEMPEEKIPLDLPASRDNERAELANAAPARASAPPADARAAKEDKKLSEVIVTGSRQRVESAPSSWTPTHVAAPVDNMPTQGVVSLEKVQAPEAWYAAIEKLRREGKTKDADRELERLKKAYPGWLEEHLKKEKPP